MYFTLQKVDTILNAMAKVLSAFSFKEDRLGAIKVLCDFWHNCCKKHNENIKEEQEALATAGKQIHISKVIQCFAV